MKEYENEYWVCIIGPTTRDKLPYGADTPMRKSMESTFERLTGHENNVCWSGWGNDREKVELINTIWSLEKDDPIYISVMKGLRDRKLDNLIR